MGQPSENGSTVGSRQFFQNVFLPKMVDFSPTRALDLIYSFQERLSAQSASSALWGDLYGTPLPPQPFLVLLGSPIAHTSWKELLWTTFLQETIASSAVASLRPTDDTHPHPPLLTILDSTHPQPVDLHWSQWLTWVVSGVTRTLMPDKSELPFLPIYHWNGKRSTQNHPVDHLVANTSITFH